MKKTLSRKYLILLAVLVANVVNILSGVLVNVISDDVKVELMRVGIFQYRIQMTVGLGIVGLLVAAWVFKADKGERDDKTLADAMPEAEKAAREFLADLAGRYRKRNANKLDGRYMISLSISDDF